MQSALSVYTDGVPYNFGSLGLHDTINSGGPPAKDRMYPTEIINVTPPDYSAELAEEMYQKIASQPDYPAGTCGGCGADKTDNDSPLLKCVGCKEQEYCSRGCQKKHWPKHKTVCTLE